MQRPSIPRHPPDGFTLVELLVVISVIAMLISLLLPALSGARQQARITQCLSQVRQMGVAAASVEADEGYVLPHWGKNDKRWGQHLFDLGYIQSKEAFRCPIVRENGNVVVRAGLDLNTALLTNYIINGNLARRTHNNVEKPGRINDIKRSPSTTLLFWDYPQTRWANEWTTLRTWHYDWAAVHVTHPQKIEPYVYAFGRNVQEGTSTYAMADGSGIAPRLREESANGINPKLPGYFIHPTNNW